jgi:hypothetical protein
MRCLPSPSLSLSRTLVQPKDTPVTSVRRPADTRFFDCVASDPRHIGFHGLVRLDFLQRTITEAQQNAGGGARADAEPEHSDLCVLTSGGRVVRRARHYYKLSIPFLEHMPPEPLPLAGPFTRIMET